MPNYVGGVGPLAPKIMLIGEAPGRQENDSGVPFVGPTGELVNECLQSAGIKRSEIYITNVVKYQPPFNDLKKLSIIGVSLQEQIDNLWEHEIRTFRPNVIIAVGDLALQATTGLSGITLYRGSILLAKDGVTKVVPTVHPAALLRQGEKGGLGFVYLQLIKHDFLRAAEESASRELHLPDRHLVVAHNSLDIHRFFQEYEKLDKACVDIESINCVPVSIGFAFTRHHAISIPLLTHIGKHKLTDMSENEMTDCWYAIDKELRRIKIVGQNFKYDEFKLNLIGFETPTVVSDVLIKTRVLFPELPEKRLHVISSVWTREPYYKDDGKEFKLGKQNIEQFLKYNARDCAVSLEVDEEQEIDLLEMQETYKVPLVKYYYDYMMKKHKLYLKMETRGFFVDVARKKELFDRYTQMQLETHAKLTEMIGYDVNVKSPPQVYNLLYKAMKFKPLKREPTSEDTIVRLLGNHAKTKEKKEILETLLQERRIRDQKSRYINFVLDYDGKCKTSFNISATETCRSSTSVPKKPIRPKRLGLAFHTISKHGELAKDIRSMLVVQPGKVFIQADASQAEARVVALLSKDWELLAAFDKIDIHRRTAALIFNYTQFLNLTEKKLPVIDDMDKDGPERFCGKKTRHAGNYDMGKGRFMTEFNTDAQKFGIKMDISEWKAGKMLDAFHAASPNIRKVFHQEIRDALDSTRCLIDPFGGVRIFYGRHDEELYKEGYANIPQRTVGHLVQGAAIKIDEELNGDTEVYFISENHDSLLIEAPESNWEPYAKLMQKHMQAPIDFGLYCTLKRDYLLTIPCDIELSTTNYGDFKKVKI